MDTLAAYREIWFVDFEFSQPPGERPIPICMVAREYRSGKLIRLWRDELEALPEPPFSINENSLFIAYYASAELGCFLALNWEMPARILDLCAEFKLFTSGLDVPCGRGLLGAMAYYGLPAIEAAEKASLQALAARGGVYSGDERKALLDYCQSDVDALARLLDAMAGKIDLPRALLRGRYMAACAFIEWNGIPIDIEILAGLRAYWPDLQKRLIARVDQNYGVYDGLTFKADRFAAWLSAHSIEWPMLQSGALMLDDDTFREMAKLHPEIEPIRQLRTTLAQLRLNDLAIGSDGRNRCLISAFGSKTGRNQPSNSKFIFGPAAWLRGLIKPEAGRVLAYVDYEQQEFGIAGALSGDQAMMAAYQSDDPYLTFAKQAGAIPADATKQSHKEVREQFKVCALAVQYGMGAEALARKLGEPVAQARELLRLHKQTYNRYWQWSDAIAATAQRDGKLTATFGWTVHAGPSINYRSLRNFPIQANGAEMLRIACILAVERGIKVCATVHDALLIETSTYGIDEPVDIAAMQFAMEEASEIVLNGFRLRTDVKIVRYPDRFIEDRGRDMWQLVCKLLEEIQTGNTPITDDTSTPITGNRGVLSPVIPPSIL